MRQWQEAKAEHPDMVLFFRMGDFYEFFNEDAKLAAEILGLTLTSRDKGGTPLAGVPHHQCDRYVKELIEKGYKVAICDQLEDPSQARGVVKRGVTRVITPGTVIDDNCLKGSANNFLAGVCAREDRAGLACVDVSTGEFFVCEMDAGGLGDELERLAPAETLVADNAMTPGSGLEKLLDQRAVGIVTKRDGYHFDPDRAARLLMEHFQVSTLDGFGLADAEAAVSVAGALLQYLQETQKASLGHISSLRLIDPGDYLVLDRVTQRNLELTHPLLHGSRASTLLSVIDRTRTGPGSRMLRNWLLRPLAGLEPIVRRQQAVRELMESGSLRAELRELLSGIADMERIMARVTTGRANARDLVALGASARLLPDLAGLGENFQAPLLAELAARIDRLEELEAAVSHTLVDEPPAQVREGRMIRSGVHPELDELREVAHGGRDWIASFQASEQERTGIPSLKIGFNKVFGYYIEITKTHKDKAPDDYERKQTLVNAERYITPQLKEYESKVLGAEERIVALEYELFVELREQVALDVERVQQVASALAQLDCIAALAEVGAHGRYVIPEVHRGLETVIEEGRHPVVETLLPDGEFVANDTGFSPEDATVLIVTGPNMAGKSTFIRQVALITILAHMGAPVPARSARIGLVDRVFTRVGAADDLARGQSTFMVEMTETANILNNATERSLIILDEVGRGTSTFDGVSLAWAITEYLHNRVKARTLFATHYHEVAELGSILAAAKNLNVAVREWSDEIIFMHHIQAGSCDRSYGIQVGRLAGIPRPVIARAQEILRGLEDQAAERDWKVLHEGETLRAAARAVQLELFSPPKPDADEFLREVADLDTDRMSPLQAHEALRRLVEKARVGRVGR